MPAAGAGELTVIIPLAAVHVAGGAAVAVGAPGAVGAGPTVTDAAAEVQPAAFLTVTLYVPGAALNTPVVLV